VANGGRERRRDAPATGFSDAPAGEPSTAPSAATVPAPQPEPLLVPERLHCFVETEELRRLLCLMAGTELLSEMCRRLVCDGSAGEV
jgi:hypothetical protein